MKIQNTPNRAAFDVQSAQDLRSQFAKNPQEGLKAAAQQFETMFLQMVMKSMRDTVPDDGMLNSEQSKFYTSLLDQQMAQNLSSNGKGVGFAKLIEQQLGRTMVGNAPEGDAQGAANAAAGDLPLAASDGRHLQYKTVLGNLPTSAAYPRANATAAPAAATEMPANSKEFVNRVWPYAVEASRSTGVPPQFLVAHSALESGWGRSEIRRADGSPSYNLFGIKAGKNWNGATADTTTTEYVNGQPQQSVERFRAYGSYEEAFRDYANLLRNNARFGAVIGSQDGTEFAKRLQQAGYATDPMYADKLSRIINGPALRQALIG
ncbi:flagellar assembly peptidoglycan hydrolase FlgJ [Dechloromonas sp. CZR5]|uniref:flagellar assembly peptidoglycan hydrolase FlgJ n=1 Tax=Dechloromonas sp. CZR5 TaxID=2608630 RepID=UPI001CC69CD1|nr:flagellar assembly peptidoglycan hydrolase FlgJ [Dechloromonas sp. CZR5]